MGLGNPLALADEALEDRSDIAGRPDRVLAALGVLVAVADHAPGLRFEEGLVYYFRFDEHRHTLVCSDRLYVQERIAGGPVLFSAQPEGDNPGLGLVSSNYTLNYQGNNLTITKALLNVIADAKTKVYGDADPSLTYWAMTRGPSRSRCTSSRPTPTWCASTRDSGTPAASPFPAACPASRCGMRQAVGPAVQLGVVQALLAEGQRRRRRRALDLLLEQPVHAALQRRLPVLLAAE